MKKLLLLAVFLFLLTCSQALAADNAVPEGTIVTAIEIAGNHNISKEAISEPILTRIGDPLSSEKLRGDAKAIYALGYFSDIKVTLKKFANGAKIIFTVFENAMITKININGVTAYSTDEVMSLITVKEGEVLDYRKLQNDIKTIDALYKDDGYLLAKVIDVATDEKTGILTFQIIEGIIEAITIQ
ncbi:MAG: POTRA domain-containing protein, partial [bacterium]